MPFLSPRRGKMAQNVSNHKRRLPAAMQITERPQSVLITTTFEEVFCSPDPAHSDSHLLTSAPTLTRLAQWRELLARRRQLESPRPVIKFNNSNLGSTPN